MCFACRADAARLAIAKALGHIRDTKQASLIDMTAIAAAMDLAGLSLTEIVMAANGKWLLVDGSKADAEFYRQPTDIDGSVTHAEHHPGNDTKH
jgi:hypothetical protein